jgi:hypothetical protein
MTQYPRQAAYKRRLQARGLCVTCRRPSAPFTYCQLHRAINTAYQRRYFVALQTLRSLGS